MSGALPATADAVVVGGGVVGAATARAIARTGRRTVLLEQGQLGGAVSGASLACLGTHMNSIEELPWLIRATAMWARLDEELEHDVEYRRCGQIRFVDREADLPVAQRWIDAERAHGLPRELLDPQALIEVEPALTGPVVAATWSPQDAVVNPFLAVRALVADGKLHGVDVHPDTPVDALGLAGGTLDVSTARGRIAAPVVVLASGPWARRLAASAGVDLAIRPRKAQCLATTRRPPTIRGVVGACESAGGVEAGYTQIQQAASGQILFNTVLAGGLSEEGAQDLRHEVDPSFVLNSIATLARLFPSLAEASLLRSWARFEAVTPDDRFLAGPTGVPGLYAAAGDNGSGFCRAPMIAELIAACLDGTADPAALALYDPRRFEGRA